MVSAVILFIRSSLAYTFMEKKLRDIIDGTQLPGFSQIGEKSLLVFRAEFEFQTCEIIL